MRFLKGKLFFKDDMVQCFDYDVGIENYRKFIRKLRDDGYIQVTVIPDMMLDYIQFIYSETDRQIYNIEFMDEDDELDVEIQNLINNVNSNMCSYILLLERLRSLIDESCIDIKRIYVKNSGYHVNEDYFVQTNGILGVDEAHYSSVVNEMVTFVNSFLSN